MAELRIRDVPTDVHETLRIEAIKAKKSLNQIIIDVLKKHVKEGEKAS